MNLFKISNTENFVIWGQNNTMIAKNEISYVNQDIIIQIIVNLEIWTIKLSNFGYN